MATEKRGVLHIMSVLERCSDLDPRLDWNDRTPLTDGSVDLYEPGKGKVAKRYLRHRVDVQVKTKTVSKKGRLPKSYQADIVDLNGWLNLKGVILFVVFYGSKFEAGLAHYAVLGPLNIRKLLQGVGEKQKTVAVPLKALPEGEANLDALLRFAAQTQRELITIEPGSPLIPDVESLEFYAESLVAFDKPISFSSSESGHLLVGVTASGDSYALDGDLLFSPEEYTEKVVDLEVVCGRSRFETVTRRKVEEDTTELRLSPGLVLQLQMASGRVEVKVNYAPQGDFEGRRLDLAFVSSCVQGEALRIGELSLDRPTADSSEYGIILEESRSLERLAELFRILGVESQLVDIDELDDGNLRQLLDLAVYVVDGRNLPQRYRTTQRIRQQIGGWSVELLCAPSSDQEGHWGVRSLLDPDLPYVFAADRRNESGDPDRFLITAHDAVGDDVFARTINLRLDNLVSAYGRIFENPEIPRIVNEMVLRLINSADLEPRRELVFLSEAERLAGWLVEKGDRSPENLINLWQVLQRRGGLEGSHEAEIRTLRRGLARRDDTEATLALIGCDALLKDKGSVEYLIAELSEDVLDRAAKWPIWRLVRELIDGVPS